MSPALAGGFLTTAPPGKSRVWFFIWKLLFLPQERVLIEKLFPPLLPHTGMRCECLSHGKQLIHRRGLYRDISRTSSGMGDAEQKPWCWKILQNHHLDFKQNHHWFMLLHTFLLLLTKDFHTKILENYNVRTFPLSLPCITPQAPFLTYKICSRCISQLSQITENKNYFLAKIYSTSLAVKEIRIIFSTNNLWIFKISYNIVRVLSSWYSQSFLMGVYIGKIYFLRIV